MGEVASGISEESAERTCTRVFCQKTLTRDEIYKKKQHGITI